MINNFIGHAVVALAQFISPFDQQIRLNYSMYLIYFRYSGFDSVI